MPLPLENIEHRMITRNEAAYLQTIPRSVLRNLGMSTNCIYIIHAFSFDNTVSPIIPPELIGVDITAYSNPRETDRVQVRRDAIETMRAHLNDNTASDLNNQDPPLDANAPYISSGDTSPDARIRRVDNDPDDSPDRESEIDIERKYLDCYFPWGNRLFKFTRLIGGRLSCMDFENEQLYLFNYNPNLFIHPKMGYINTTHSAIFLERSYKRSSARYKRGFNNYSFNAQVISERELVNLNLAPSRDNGVLVIDYFGNELYNRTYPSYNQAIERLLNFDVLSVAISNSIAIALNSYYNKFVILKNKWVIGEYSAKKEMFVLNNNLFTEDLDKLNVQYEVSDENR